MKSTHRSSRRLQIGALVLLIAGMGAWTATGARVGWTQTSAVTMQRDEITGIDYPVRRTTFVPGVEVPVLAAAIAAVLAGASLFPRRVAQRA